MSILEQNNANVFERKPERYSYHKVDVFDAFDTGERDRITTSLRELESMGYYGDADVQNALNRKRLSAIDYENPATKGLLERVPGVEHWLSLVPTPRALSPLYNPDTEVLPDGHVVGDELRTWMIELGDARGLRYRKQMVTDLLVDEVSRHEHEGTPSRWLSVASGAAQQVLQAARTVADLTGQAPDTTLVDLSSEALGDAARSAQELGIGESLHIERMNVLRRQGLHTSVGMGEIALQRLFNSGDRMKLARKGLTRESYDVVEAVGILEYVKPEDWTYRYNGVVNLKTVQAGAKTLLENCYRLVKPGGDLIVGNMLDTHPQLGFTLNVIQWPHIQPRSIDQMMDLFDAAELSAERHVYVPSDDENSVYALYRIHKPDSEAE